MTGLSDTSKLTTQEPRSVTPSSSHPTAREKGWEVVGRLVKRYYELVQRERTVKSKEEEMTKQELITPLFHALGWNTENSDEVTLEENISHGYVDYGFRIDGIPKFFVEAKAFREDLDNVKFFEQAVNYAYAKGCA